MSYKPIVVESKLDGWSGPSVWFFENKSSLHFIRTDYLSVFFCSITILSITLVSKLYLPAVLDLVFSEL